jgi:adenosylcobinamide-GDP ribazoletransferase
MTPGVLFRGLGSDFKISLIFFTRLPVGHRVPIESADLARASWAAPLVGAIVGILGAGAYGLTYRIGLPPLAAAALALATTMLATGCLHEDGLADVADGFGGGATRGRKLEIMRDSRVGTYGVCVLALSLVLRVSALASLTKPALVVFALVAAHTAARAVLPAFMAFVPPARNEGLSASAGQPPRESIAAAAFIGIIALDVSFGITTGVVALVLLLSGFFCLAWICIKQIGGQTGDVLGALEQVSETIILLSAAAAI